MVDNVIQFPTKQTKTVTGKSVPATSNVVKFWPRNAVAEKFTKMGERHWGEIMELGSDENLHDVFNGTSKTEEPHDRAHKIYMGVSNFLNSKERHPEQFPELRRLNFSLKNTSHKAIHDAAIRHESDYRSLANETKSTDHAANVAAYAKGFPMSEHDDNGIIKFW